MKIQLLLGKLFNHSEGNTMTDEKSSSHMEIATFLEEAKAHKELYSNISAIVQILVRYREEISKFGREMEQASIEHARIIESLAKNCQNTSLYVSGMIIPTSGVQIRNVLSEKRISLEHFLEEGFEKYRDHQAIIDRLGKTAQSIIEGSLKEDAPDKSP